jgi:sigma-B regulation protein RsbU (phosphoserine phosphatase)
LASGRLEYCNAGHPPLVIVRPDGGAEFLEAKRNIVAGAMDGYAYAMEEASFERGTMLLAYTDGVTEAERADHEQYGEKRLLEFAAAHAKDTPVGFVAGMEQAINAFTSGAEQSDDITAIAIRVDGRGAN